MAWKEVDKIIQNDILATKKSYFQILQVTQNNTHTWFLLQIVLPLLEVKD
jgi:hypothetical protein